MEWTEPNAPPPLGDDEIHVWRVDLARAGAALEGDRDALSAEELRRAARHRFPLHRERWTAARAALRRILGLYLGVDPRAVEIVARRSGKPALAGDSPLRFNTSHSGPLALVAVGRGREVGVDLERLRADLPVEALTARWLAAAEADAIRRLPPSVGRAAFFATWTRKEAWIKARGGRVPADLRRFAVAVDPLPGAVPVTAAGGTAGWSLVALDLAPGYAAAVAARGAPAVIRFAWPARGLP